MKINVVNNSVLNNLSTMNQSHSTRENTFIKSAVLNSSKAKESPAVKISISLEGKQKYRERLGDKNQSRSYESLNEPLQNLPEIGSDKILFKSEMHGKLQSMAGGKTTEEKAAALLKIYASMYDEIMQKKNDDNEDFISEQINELNEALKGETDFLECMVRLAPVFAAALEKYANTLSECAKTSKNSMALDDMESRARNEILRLKNDIVPENLHEKIMTASKLFMEQYSIQKDGNIIDIIDNIVDKIFLAEKNKDSE